MNNTFLTLLDNKPYLLCDGATGTNLFAMGLETGEAPELWNLQQPEKISAHYQSFIDAGSDIILTNTFGGTRYRLKLHNAQDQVEALNVSAAKLARACADSADHPIAVAGSIGPTGEIFSHLGGNLTHEDAVAAFAEQAKALADGGVDVLWIETMSSTEEVNAAIEGCQSVGLPMVYTFSIDTNGKSMMGISATQIVQMSGQLPAHAHACGTNCGVGAAEVVAAIVNMKNASSEGSPLLVAKANCGIPEYIDGKIVYNGTPELMAKYTHLALDAGAKIVGGCCGTSPHHIRAMREAMDNYTPSGHIPTLDEIQQALGDVSEGAKAELSGETAPVAKRATRRRRK